MGFPFSIYELWDMIEIKDISGKTRFSTSINKGAKGKFTLMKEDYIILPFSVSEPIPFKLGDYVDLAGVLDESLGGKMSKIYEITDIQKPTYNTSTGGYDYNLQMNAYYWKWKNKIFKYTPENAGSEASWSLTASLDVQLGVFLRNLKALGYTYRGQDFEFEIDSTVENKAVAMSYDNINLLDALFSMAGEDQWNCDCWITDNVIHFGRCEYGNAVKIERDVEAASITRSDSQGTYATRIYAFGGTRNIPSNYGKKFIDSVSFIQGDVRFTGLLHNTNYYLNDGADVQVRFLTGADENKIFSVRWTAGNFYFQSEDVCNASVGDRFELLNFSDDVPDRYLSYGTEDLVVNGVVQKRLMMPADTPYIDVFPDMTQEEAIEGIVVFDDIYPKRVGTMSEVNTVPRDIKEDDKVVGTFDAYQFKDSGFVFDKKYQIEGTDLKIIFQSGKMNGMEFGVIFDPDKKDEQLWEVVRSEDYGRPLPDEYIHPENGDQYVLSGFNIKLVSDQYIPNAQQELKERARKYADKVKIDDGTYPTTLRSDWVKGDLISRTFDFGQRINLVDDTFFEDGRISRVLGWEMNLDIPWDSPVYTIGESMPYSRIEEIEDKVDSLVFNGQTYTGIYGSGGSKIYVIKTNDSTSASDSNVFSALRSLATFLRKDKEDSTKYLLTLLAGAVFGENKASIGADGVAKFVSMIINEGKASIASDGAAVLLSAIFNDGKARVDSDGAAKFLSILLGTGIETENFSTGALGAGFCLKKDENGDTYLEVDRMLVRKVATFIELLIQKLRYVGGQIILSPASMSCAKVEDKGDYYRCYFQNTDGDKTIEQEFVVGDQARSQTFNIKTGKSSNAKNSYYWRLVVGVGDDYIDLSKTDCDAGSTVPQAGDDIVQLGNRTETDRQAAIVLAAYGNDAPYIKMYRGINSYVLDGKEFVTISRTKVNITADSLKFATGENVKDEINKVVTSANEAVISANNAVASANEANQKAEEAKNRLDSWAADGVISPTEKQSLKDEIVRIDADKTQIENGYAKYGLGTPTSYTNAYNSYYADLVTLSQDSPENITIPATFSATQNEYYNQRTLALTAISNAAKDAIDDIESDFNGKIDKVNSSITQTKNEITLEVNSVKSDLATFKEETNTKFSVQDGKITSAVTESKEYADEVANGLTTKIEENSSKIEQLPNQITLQVKKDITTGGLNYIANTQGEVVAEGQNKENQIITGGWKIHPSIAGKKYGAAFKIKFEGCTFSTSSTISLQAGSENGWSYNGLTGYNKVSENKEYVFYRNTNTAPSALTGYESVRIRVDYVSGGKITISEIRAYDVPEGLVGAFPWYPSKWDTEVLSSEIKQTADSITSTVKKEIGDITIGGDNCISNSDFSNGTSGWSYSSVTISADSSNTHVTGINVLRVVQTSASDSNLDSIRIFQYTAVSSGNTVSFSCWIKASTSTKIRIRLCGGSDNMKEFSVGTTWTYITFENVTASSTAVILGATSACTWYLSEPMLVKANKAISWAKRLSEQRDEISTIKQTSNSISLKVDQLGDGLDATGIDITNKKIDITADKLSIKANSGKSVAVFDGTGEVPKIKSDCIDVDNLKVKYLQGATGTFKGVLEAASGSFNGELVVSLLRTRLYTIPGGSSSFEVRPDVDNCCNYYFGENHVSSGNKYPSKINVLLPQADFYEGMEISFFRMVTNNTSPYQAIISTIGKIYFLNPYDSDPDFNYITTADKALISANKRVVFKSMDGKWFNIEGNCYPI